LTSLRAGQRNNVNLSENSRKELIFFIKIFQRQHKKEFYSDTLSNALLRKFNFDKEYNIVIAETKEAEKRTDEFGISKSAAVKILESIKNQGSNEDLHAWNTMQIAFAFHSKDQDVIFDQIQSLNVDWLMLQKLSIPIWLKSTDKLKSLIEGVAKTAYKKAGEQIGLSSLAAVTALWYILIDKKSMLCQLYKTEPNNKKIYEMLMNDFTQDRWQKAADKNAMVLISKKNYELGIAFFILAGKIKDAIVVALNKLNDLNLAILIARLVDGYESPTVHELIDQYLINNGKDIEDPWLVSIGYWWKGQYFEAINVLSSMISETKQRLAKSVFQKSTRFDLFRQNEVLNEKDEKRNQKGDRQTKSETQPTINFEYPIISGRNAFVLDFVNQLLDHHIIKRELQKSKFAAEESSSDEDEGGSIFDDFFAGSSKKNEEAKKKAEPVKKIEVDKKMLLNIISDYYSDKGFVFLGLILAYENKEIKMSNEAADN